MKKVMTVTKTELQQMSEFIFRRIISDSDVQHVANVLLEEKNFIKTFSDLTGGMKEVEVGLRILLKSAEEVSLAAEENNEAFNQAVILTKTIFHGIICGLLLSVNYTELLHALTTGYIQNVKPEHLKHYAQVMVMLNGKDSFDIEVFKDEDEDEDEDKEVMLIKNAGLQA